MKPNSETIASLSRLLPHLETMSTVVYQSLQSSLEPRLTETLVFKHNLASSKPTILPNIEEINSKENKKRTNKTFGVSSFIELFQTTLETKTEKVYVHPSMKRSSMALSKHSLDMCTESLGSETGNYTLSNHELSSLLPTTKEKIQSKPRGICKKMLPIRSFPPPLSSSHNFQVKPHRENGRLVISATRKASPNNYFQTERKNGRLKLSLLKEEHQNCEVEEDIHGARKCIEDIAGNCGKVCTHIDNKPNRCKEARSGRSKIPNWGPFLVASS